MKEFTKVEKAVIAKYAEQAETEFKGVVNTGSDYCEPFEVYARCARAHFDGDNNGKEISTEAKRTALSAYDKYEEAIKALEQVQDWLDDIWKLSNKNAKQYEEKIHSLFLDVNLNLSKFVKCEGAYNSDAWTEAVYTKGQIEENFFKKLAKANK